VIQIHAETASEHHPFLQHISSSNSTIIRYKTQLHNGKVC